MLWFTLVLTALTTSLHRSSSDHTTDAGRNPASIVRYLPPRPGCGKRPISIESRYYTRRIVYTDAYGTLCGLRQWNDIILKALLLMDHTCVNKPASETHIFLLFIVSFYLVIRSHVALFLRCLQQRIYARPFISLSDVRMRRKGK